MINVYNVQNMISHTSRVRNRDGFRLCALFFVRTRFITDASVSVSLSSVILGINNNDDDDDVPYAPWS